MTHLSRTSPPHKRLIGKAAGYAARQMTELSRNEIYQFLATSRTPGWLVAQRVLTETGSGPRRRRA
jgi:hypothetical protein